MLYYAEGFKYLSILGKELQETIGWKVYLTTDIEYLMFRYVSQNDIIEREIY